MTRRFPIVRSRAQSRPISTTPSPPTHKCTVLLPLCLWPQSMLSTTTPQPTASTCMCPLQCVHHTRAQTHAHTHTDRHAHTHTHAHTHKKKSQHHLGECGCNVGQDVCALCTHTNTHTVTPTHSPRQVLPHHRAWFQRGPGGAGRAGHLPHHVLHTAGQPTDPGTSRSVGVGCAYMCVSVYVCADGGVD